MRKTQHLFFFINKLPFVYKDVPVSEEKHECLPFENIHDHGPEPAHSCPNSGTNKNKHISAAL